MESPQRLAVAFIPVANVVTAFGDLANQMPDNLPIYEFRDYFKSTGGRVSTVLTRLSGTLWMHSSSNVHSQS